MRARAAGDYYCRWVAWCWLWLCWVWLCVWLSHRIRVLLTISDVSEFSASSTVGLWRSDADVFSGDELPENAARETRHGQRIRTEWLRVGRVFVVVAIVPISPLELDSVKLGVPSVNVGVEPSTEAGGVQESTLPEP